MILSPTIEYKIKAPYFRMKIKLLSPTAKIPTKSNSGDAGFDLYSPVEVIINPGDQELIKLDIAITDFPPGTYGRIAPRSGLALQGVQVFGGVVDSTYQGNIGVILSVGTSAKTLFINPGDRIAQLIIERYEPNVTFELVDNFSQTTQRGAEGFGSTGI